MFGEVTRNFQGIYTDLDSLFDTRYATLEFISQELAILNAENNWANRDNDIPLGIERETYLEAYALRDTAILELAPQTACISGIRNWVNKALSVSAASPHPITVKLFVNTFPYRLDKEVAVEIGEKISSQLGELIEVVMVNNVPPERITVGIAKMYFSAMFVYDWRHWLETQAKEGHFKNALIPDVTLYAPRIVFDKLPGEEERARYKETGRDHFDEAEFIAARMIRLEFIESVFFNAVIPKNIREIIKKTEEMA